MWYALHNIGSFILTPACTISRRVVFNVVPHHNKTVLCLHLVSFGDTSLSTYRSWKHHYQLLCFSESDQLCFMLPLQGINGSRSACRCYKAFLVVLSFRSKVNISHHITRRSSITVRCALTRLKASCIASEIVTGVISTWRWWLFPQSLRLAPELRRKQGKKALFFSGHLFIFFSVTSQTVTVFYEGRGDILPWRQLFLGLFIEKVIEAR